ARSKNRAASPSSSWAVPAPERAQSAPKLVAQSLLAPATPRNLEARAHCEMQFPFRSHSRIVFPDPSRKPLKIGYPVLLELAAGTFGSAAALRSPALCVRRVRSSLRSKM